ncbi:oxygen-insensitive NADPH nitroreductase [Fictibacillus iocasae]|uniref:Oxygen-insensitive NADPH nitroreductase n=1 Tax=Fictibacillus iocasae TaxID=2715437 RepID=A0ABW2NNA4_9BACL
MNQTIETILSHRSIRKFKNETLDQKTVETLVKCAQAASTSSYQQVYSIIGVEDSEMKKKLAVLAGGQDYVAENGYFFVFCLDYHRHMLSSVMTGADITATVQSMEGFIVGTADAALAAQNMAVAAESLGLGIVYIGGIRNNIQEVSDLLKCPDHVVPLFGLAVGVPAANPGTKPRLPMNAVFHHNTYKSDDELKNELQRYEQETAAYYAERTDGKRTAGWVSHMMAAMEVPKRTFMKDFLNKKGLNKK